MLGLDRSRRDGPEPGGVAGLVHPDDIEARAPRRSAIHASCDGRPRISDPSRGHPPRVTWLSLAGRFVYDGRRRGSCGSSGVVFDATERQRAERLASDAARRDPRPRPESGSVSRGGARRDHQADVRDPRADAGSALGGRRPVASIALRRSADLTRASPRRAWTPRRERSRLRRASACPGGCAGPAAGRSSSPTCRTTTWLSLRVAQRHGERELHGGVRLFPSCFEARGTGGCSTSWHGVAGSTPSPQLLAKLSAIPAARSASSSSIDAPSGSCCRPRRWRAVGQLAGGVAHDFSQPAGRDPRLRAARRPRARTGAQGHAAGSAPCLPKAAGRAAAR